MAESRFDIQFAGELVPGADPLRVRAHLRDLFRLAPEALERLFNGRPVIIKRDLDPVTAGRYRDAFRDAGAVLHLVVSSAAVNPAGSAGPAPEEQGPAMRTPSSETGLTLAPLGADVGEAVASFPPRSIDTSNLSLVPSPGWSLEDCAPAPVPPPIPDLSHLSLAPTEPTVGRDTRDLHD